MEQYILKSALVAEFNRLIAELIEEGEGTMFERGRISAFEDAKLFLNSLEVKEVEEEPVSEELEEAARNAAERYRTTRDRELAEKCKWSFKAGAQWGKNQAMAEI